MYGSYPEITIAMRFITAKIQRLGNFLANPPIENWPITYDELLEIAKAIRSNRYDKLSHNMLN